MATTTTTTMNNRQLFQAKGHHLLLDVYDADREALNNETEMRRVAVDLVESSGMEMLSIHSHILQPQGVSVVAILKESH